MTFPLNPSPLPELPDMGLVSIIMPAYNPGRYFQEAVESVLAQSYPHWELLIINDASTDDTLAQAQAFAARDSRIRVIDHEKLGNPAKVRNVGLRLAQGDFIAFLDADDAFLPQSLAMLLHEFHQHPEYRGVFGFAWQMNAEGEHLKATFQLVMDAKGEWALPSYYRPYHWKDLIFGINTCLLSAMMLRREFQNEVGFFDEVLCGPEDFEYYLRLHIADMEHFRCIPKYIYRYRIHDQSLTKLPDKLNIIIQSNVAILNSMFAHPKIKEVIAPYRSQAHLANYYYQARQQLIFNNPALCRQIVWQALTSPDIRRTDWLKQALPLLLRSFLPHRLNRIMMDMRKKLRE